MKNGTEQPVVYWRFNTHFEHKFVLYISISMLWYKGIVLYVLVSLCSVFSGVAPAGSVVNTTHRTSECVILFGLLKNQLHLFTVVYIVRSGTYFKFS